MSCEPLLLAAVQIRDYLLRTAMWSGKRCAWEIVTLAEPHGRTREGRRMVAGGGIYQGTAGVALFLVELERLVPDPKGRAAAFGALEHATNAAEGLPHDACGFYSGRVGIGWALARAAAVIGSERCFDSARAVLHPMLDAPRSHDVNDVIAGAAGAIVPLVELADILGEVRLRTAAIRLAEDAILDARRHAFGWSWSCWPISWRRDLCGFAHGAAGIGYGFLELWNVTGDDRYANAAEQAFAYERHELDGVEGNWPDHRNLEFNSLLGNPGELRKFNARVRRVSGAPAADTLRFQSAWCHGAPGIALTRLRAYELLGRKIYRHESEVAVNTTVRMLGEQNNYSLCHGRSGNTEALLMASRVLRNESLRVTAVDVMMQGVEQFGQTPDRWPSGTVDGQSDPSLLMGASGVGYALLRMVDTTVPSILFATTASVNRNVDDVAIEACARQEWHATFGESLTAASTLGMEMPAQRAPGEPPSQLGEVANALRMYAAGDTIKALALREVQREEMAAFELVEETMNLLEDILARDSHAYAFQWADTPLTLSSRVRLLTAESGDAAVSRLEAMMNGCAHIVFVRGGKTHRRAIAAVPARILQLFTQPRTCSDVAAILTKEIESDAESLNEMVRKQVAAALASRILVLAVETTDYPQD